MTVSPEDSEHTTSDNHGPLTPTPAHKEYLDSLELRPASVLPVAQRRRRHTDRPGRFSFQKDRRQRPTKKAPLFTRKSGTSGTSGGSNASSEEEGAQGIPPEDIEPPVAPNSGICCTIIRAVNPLNGQTALHRAAVAGQHENLTLLLRADPECAMTQDRKGDTALHMACRHTQKKTHRKTVEALLACDKVDASVLNHERKMPEEECPHSRTRKMVAKRSTKDKRDKLDLPTPPNTDPRSGLKGIPESLSGTSSSDKPLSFTTFNEQMAALKRQYREVKSSTSDQDTSN